MPARGTTDITINQYFSLKIRWGIWRNVSFVDQAGMGRAQEALIKFMNMWVMKSAVSFVGHHPTVPAQEVRINLINMGVGRTSAYTAAQLQLEAAFGAPTKHIRNKTWSSPLIAVSIKIHSPMKYICMTWDRLVKRRSALLIIGAGGGRSECRKNPPRVQQTCLTVGLRVSRKKSLSETTKQQSKSNSNATIFNTFL